MSVESCKPPEEPKVDVKECLDNYKTLAYQFFGIDIPMGKGR